MMFTFCPSPENVEMQDPNDRAVMADPERGVAKSTTTSAVTAVLLALMLSQTEAPELFWMRRVSSAGFVVTSAAVRSVVRVPELVAAVS